MKKSVLLGVSISAILSATGANAAGYTCEELIEYTSCNPGYYLSGVTTGVTTMGCPDDYPTYRAGLCRDEYNYVYEPSYATEEECMNAGFEDPSGGNSASWEPGPYCIGEDEWGEFEFVDLVEKDVLRTGCLECPVGSTCAGGDKNVQPVVCPAGSYCATAGLSQPSGQCAKGTYSTGGAIACSSCPVSGLTDANGNIVSVTTESTGSTSSSACFVAKGTLFKDNRGIYRYTDNCTYGNIDILGDRFYEPANGTCVDGFQYMEAYEDGGCSGRNGDCLAISVTGCYRIPDSEEWCYEVDGVWTGDTCECTMEWFGDTKGIYTCTNT